MQNPKDNAISFGRMQKEDVAEIYSFSKEVLNETWNQKELEKSIKSPFYICLKAYDREIAGAIHLSIVKDEAYINFFAVKAARQRNSIGTKLLQYAVEYCSFKKVFKVMLEVSEVNKAAINVYKKAGFKLYGKRKKFYHDKDGNIYDALVLGYEIC